MSLQIQRLEPELQNVHPGTVEWFEAQRRVLQRKRLIRAAYETWYRCFRSDWERASNRAQTSVELGSGAGFLKNFIPDLITSDVTPGVADRVLDARDLPFEPHSLRALFLTHVFHHIPDVERFLTEAARVLAPGGVLSLIEVARTPLAKLVFTHAHPEPFDDRAVDWNFASTHSMLDSNQALSWIVFRRDLERFRKLHPDLILEHSAYLPWFSYLVSGGLTQKPLIPRALTPLVSTLDSIRVFDPLCALHWHLRIRRR